MRGWWWRVAARGGPSGLWRTLPRGLEQVLPWCPQVLARFAELDYNGKPSTEYFTVRVDDHVATLSSHSLHEGHGWEQFRTIDLWPCLAFRPQLSNIVRGQAQSLSRIDFRGPVR